MLRRTSPSKRRKTRRWSIEDEDAITGTETPPPTPAPLLASMETPPPLAANTTAGYARRGAPTLLGMPLSVVAVARQQRRPRRSWGLGFGEDDHDLGDDDDEVTVMARPSVTDDEEEATKVEPAETAIRAAASKDDDDEDELTAALSTQASVERERALRKSLPPSLDVPLSAHSYRAGESSGAEFASSADLADDGDVVAGGRNARRLAGRGRQRHRVVLARIGRALVGAGSRAGAAPADVTRRQLSAGRCGVWRFALQRVDAAGADGRFRRALAHAQRGAGADAAAQPIAAAAGSFAVLVAPGAGRRALPAHDVARADWVRSRRCKSRRRRAPSRWPARAGSFGTCSFRWAGWSPPAWPASSAGW